MKQLSRKHLWVIFCIITSLLLYSCGGGGGGDSNTTSGSTSADTITVTGSVAQSYTVASRTSVLDKLIAFFTGEKAIAAGQQVDTIWALPTIDGSIWPESFNYKVKISINSDGTFTLNLPKTATVDNSTFNLDWLLLLINSKAQNKTDMIVSYIALNDLTDSLLWMPISNATDNVDLGQLTPVGNEARSSTTLSDVSNSFTLSLDQLKQIAKSDDVLKNIKNVFLNYNESTGEYWFLQPYFAWKDIPGSIKNQWSNPANLQFIGYAFYLETNNTTDPTFNEICNGTKKLRFYPPETVSLMDNSKSFGLSAPIETEQGQIQQRQDGAQECGGTYFYLRDDTNTNSFHAGYMYNFIVGDDNLLSPISSSQPFPTGYWLLKSFDGNQETEIGKFDLTAASPFDSNGKPIIFLPSLNVSVDNNNNITSVQLKFYKYDSQNGWTEVTDPTIINKMFTSLSVTFNDYDGTTSNSNQRIEEGFDILTPVPTNSSANSSVSTLPITLDVTSLDNSWKFTGDTSTTMPVADSIDVSYIFGGVSFRFVWRQ